MTKRSKIALAISGLLILIMLGLYAYFGGFSDVDVTRKSGATITIYGKPYSGSITEEEWGKLFNSADELSGRYTNASLSAYYEVAPDKKNDYTVKAFVGIIVPENTNIDEEGYEKREITFDSLLIGNKKSHPFFSRLHADLFDYGIKNNIDLDSNISLEIYRGPREMEVYIPYFQ